MKFPHLEKFADLMKGVGWVGGGGGLGYVLVRGGMGGWWGGVSGSLVRGGVHGSLVRGRVGGGVGVGGEGRWCGG